MHGRHVLLRPATHAVSVAERLHEDLIADLLWDATRVVNEVHVLSNDSVQRRLRFATYFTLLFIEHAYGRDELVAGLRDSRETVLDFYAKTPGYRVVHENLADMAQVTTAMTYQKGSWVLHVLRQAMGDDRFWAGIREYYARFRNANASTTDFRLAMEHASGLDLTPFFQQWLYRGGVPTIEGTWQWDRDAKQVVVELRQTQGGEPFHLTVEIGITAPGARARFERAELSTQSARFTFSSEEPVAVELDPGVRLLMDGTLSHR